MACGADLARILRGCSACLLHGFPLQRDGGRASPSIRVCVARFPTANGRSKNITAVEQELHLQLLVHISSLHCS